jgi:glycosyltransferase involved in cell wall biosynthesis
VGRLSHEKGPDVLLDALSELCDVAPLVSMIGIGRERAALERRVAALGAKADVRWHDLVADAGRLFRAFDVFVLSSRTEGTPIVLFEAMAAEVPIVATRVGGVPDVVSPLEATLVASGDPAALAAAIRGVRADPDGAARRAGAARERLRRDFGLEPWLDRYAALYERVRRATPVGAP